MARTTFTTITPLPSNIPRQVVVDFLHDHLEMIDLNPLIKDRHTISPPAHALPEEHRCVWYSLTDKISYLPGGVMTGEVSYTCAFHDMPDGLQTHCYAPMGLDIRDRWSVGGRLPGEPPEPVELGLNAPKSGLYLREDVDIRCNVLMATFVKKTLKKSHGSLVDRLAIKAQLASANGSYARKSASDPRTSLPSTPSSWGTPPLPSPRSDVSGTLPGGLPLPPTAQQGPQLQEPALPQLHAGQTLGPYGAEVAPSGTQLKRFSLEPPRDPRLNGALGGLRHSGTVYRGSSKPQDYDEFKELNPFDDLRESGEKAETAELEYRGPQQLAKTTQPAELG